MLLSLHISPVVLYMLKLPIQSMLIHSLSHCTDSRGLAQSIWPGNGRNFVGANNELQEALKKLSHLKVKNCFKEKVLIGFCGSRTHLEHHICEVCVNTKFEQQEVSWKDC